MRDSALAVMRRFPDRGIFMTGIESSDPHIDGARRNQLREAHDFHAHCRERLTKIAGLGIKWLRFGYPYSEAHKGRDQFDFSFLDEALNVCRELELEVVFDLLHFGLPDWLHEEDATRPYFQNPRFPAEFARYAGEFARRYPWVRFYTLVNEPFVTAYFSAKLGIWNEHRTSEWGDDRDFVAAMANIARAAILAREAIEVVGSQTGQLGELTFIQNESFEVAYVAPGAQREAEVARFNLRRFAGLDLMFGQRDSAMAAYLVEQGLPETDYEWFMTHGQKNDVVLGIDHYPTCVHTYDNDGVLHHTPDQPYRLYDIVREYWQRYDLPLVHTEVNGWPNFAVTICQQTFDEINRLRRDGVPVLGMGWYGDDLQIGWHVAMRGPKGYEESPVGLFYKGQLQPVGERYRDLLRRGFDPIGP